MKETQRYYSFRLISYASEEEIQNLLKYCTKWEYIYHDKDIKEDGTKKEPHWHINVILKQWKTITGVCKLIKSEQNTMAIPMLDKQKAHDYLTHKDDPDKYQYDEKDIKSSKKKIAEDKENKEAINEEWIEALLEARTLRQKAIKLGKDYIRYRKQYEEFINDMVKEEAEIENGININVRWLYYEDVKQQIEMYLEIRKEKIKSENYKKTAFEWACESTS